MVFLDVLKGWLSSTSALRRQAASLLFDYTFWVTGVSYGKS